MMANLDSNIPCYSGRLMAVVAGLALTVGLAVGYGVWGYRPTVDEPPLPEQRQADVRKSLVLERRPGKPLPAPHRLPRHGREVRRVAVAVQPTAASCGPVRVDLSLVRLSDDTARVIASSPDGTILSGGLDIPMEPMPVQRRFSAGASWAGGQAFGVFATTDLWRLRAGVSLAVDRDEQAEARVMVGWAF